MKHHRVGAPQRGSPERVTTPSPDQWRPDGVWCRRVEAQVSPFFSSLTHVHQFSFSLRRLRGIGFGLFVFEVWRPKGAHLELFGHLVKPRWPVRKSLERCWPGTGAPAKGGAQTQKRWKPRRVASTKSKGRKRGSKSSTCLHVVLTHK